MITAPLIIRAHRYVHWNFIVESGHQIAVAYGAVLPLNVFVLDPMSFSAWLKGEESLAAWIRLNQTGLREAILPPYPGAWVLVIQNLNASDAHVNYYANVEKLRPWWR